MEATATESRTTQDASDKYRAGYDLWMQSNGSDSDAIEAVQAMASAAYDRAKEVHAEHDRMILDLQQTIADVVQGSIAIDEVARIGCEIESFHELFYLQDRQIKELQATIEDLIAGSGVALDRVVNDAPVVTERFMHKQTAKGWRLDESSLTIDWKGTRPDACTRSELLRDSFAGGTAEADERNRNPEPASGS